MADLLWRNIFRSGSRGTGLARHDILRVDAPPRLDLEGQLVGAVGPARAVGEPFHADLVVAHEDLVSGMSEREALRPAGCEVIRAQTKRLDVPTSLRSDGGREIAAVSRGKKATSDSTIAIMSP